jgi:hypothetical protein
VLVPPVAALATSMRAIDLAYHVRLGREIIASGSIPRVDDLTFTVHGAPWVNQQWGAQVVLGAFDRLGGWDALTILQAGLIALAWTLLYLTLRDIGASARTSSVLALAGFVVASPALGLRPQLLAVPVFAAALRIIMGRRRHPWALWALPPLAVVTANIHGSFLLLPLLAFLAALSTRERDERRRLWLVVAATFGATLLNPFGWRIWGYALDLATDPIVRSIVTEWQPLSPTRLGGALALISMLGVAVILARRPYSVPWEALVWLGVFLVPAVLAERAVVWWAIVAPVMVASVLQEGVAEPPGSDDGREGRANAVGIAIAAALLVAIILVPWWRASDPRRDLRDAPVGISDAALELLPPGSRVFVYQPWASWWEYAAPDHLVFVDSRIELFPAQVWNDYREVAAGRAGWQQVLERWEVGAIAAPRWDLVRVLTEDARWELAYENDEGILLVREG